VSPQLASASPPPGSRSARGPQGDVEYVVTGSGEPVTLFVHGLAGSVAQTRPFGSGVSGTRVFAHLRGHGGTAVPQPGPGSYGDLAGEVDAVRRDVGATRALGVSLGAGALLRLLAVEPHAVERVVLALPSALDVPAPPDAPAVRRLLDLADALETGDAVRAAALLRDQQPAAVRPLPAVGLWARRRASELAGTPLPAVLRCFAGQAPLDGTAAVLAGVEVPALVLGQEGDESHPVEVARDLAAALPRADLVVLPAGHVLWAGRERLREVVAGFLDAPP
jgi:pimeloyl-ACP methyl ester carboxylesterase